MEYMIKNSVSPEKRKTDFFFKLLPSLFPCVYIVGLYGVTLSFVSFDIERICLLELFVFERRNTRFFFFFFFFFFVFFCFLFCFFFWLHFYFLLKYITDFCGVHVLYTFLF